MRIARALLFVAVLAATLLRSDAPALAQTPFDTAAWREDFAQLRRAMDEHYANLEWVAKVRRTDLAALLAKTNATLDSATTASAAQKAIADFLSAMGDGHLEVDWPEPTVAATATPGSLCERLGYRERRLSQGLQFQLLPSTSPVAGSTDRYFPVRTLNLPDGSRIGVIRIGVFSAQWYPELCASVLQQLHLSASSACDDACGDRVQIAAENELTGKLSAAILALKNTPSVRAIAVDLTRNGGGSDWEEPAARELTALPLNSPRLGFVKHEHWQKQFEDQLSSIRRDLPKASGAYRQLLLRAQRTYSDLLAVSKQHCDRSALWLDNPIDCTIVGQGDVYTTGTLSYARPDSLPHVDSAQYIFYPSLYTYQEGEYQGPLFVLVDNNTASAAERFAAMFQDAKAARIVGVPTFGAGCGFTNGGIPTQLHNSRATVGMPDCVQFRADGTNAVAGITPDVLVPWHSNDNPYQRAMRAFDTLAALH
jgi:hypothetical protein